MAKQLAESIHTVIMGVRVIQPITVGGAETPLITVKNVFCSGWDKRSQFGLRVSSLIFTQLLKTWIKTWGHKCAGDISLRGQGTGWIGARLAIGCRVNRLGVTWRLSQPLSTDVSSIPSWVCPHRDNYTFCFIVLSTWNRSLKSLNKIILKLSHHHHHHSWINDTDTPPARTNSTNNNTVALVLQKLLNVLVSACTLTCTGIHITAFSVVLCGHTLL